jgi:hypothetical protein
MPWKSFRLELANTEGFPQGSASRTYLLRLPLDEAALIDGPAVERAPELATVYRYWPNERDMFGHFTRTAHGWAIAYELDQTGKSFELETLQFKETNVIFIREPDGITRPFRVVSVRPLS